VHRLCDLFDQRRIVLIQRCWVFHLGIKGKEEEERRKESGDDGEEKKKKGRSKSLLYRKFAHGFSQIKPARRVPPDILRLVVANPLCCSSGSLYKKWVRPLHWAKNRAPSTCAHTAPIVLQTNLSLTFSSSSKTKQSKSWCYIENLRRQQRDHKMER